jgi:hypothetical protein
MELGDQHLTTALFQQFPIRRTWHEDAWWYSLVDSMAPFAETTNPVRYWSDIKRKLRREGATYEDFVSRLRLPNAEGVLRLTDCANLAGVLRVLQTVPNEKAEPFRLWLAEIGSEVITDEATARRATYRLKLWRYDNRLHDLVAFRGITTPAQHQRLTDANYAGLYDTSGQDAVARMRRIWGDPADWMSDEELGIHIFQRTQAAAQIERRDLQGDAIYATAEDVGVEIRRTLERMGSPMPEDLPQMKRLSRGDYLPDDELPTLGWGDEVEEDVG